MGTKTFWTGSQVVFTNGSKIVTVTTGDVLTAFDMYANGVLTCANYNELVEVDYIYDNGGTLTIVLMENWAGGSGTFSAKIVPSAASIAAAAVNLSALQSTFQGVANDVASTATPDSIVRRTANGRIKTAAALEIDEAVNLGQLGSSTGVGSTAVLTTDWNTAIDGSKFYKSELIQGQTNSPDNTAAGWSGFTVKLNNENYVQVVWRAAATVPQMYHRIGRANPLVWTSWAFSWDTQSLIKATSAIDANIGRIPLVGYMGLGFTGTNISNINQLNIPSGDADNAVAGGDYRVMGTEVNLPSEAQSGSVLSVKVWNADNLTQTLYMRDGRQLQRVKDLGVWKDWEQVRTFYNSLYSGTDADNILHNSKYRVGAISNLPDAWGGILETVMWSNNTAGKQIYTPLGSVAAQAEYVRFRSSGVWQSWQRIFTDTKPNVKIERSGLATINLSRNAPVTIVELIAGANQEVILGTNFEPNDVVIIVKSRNAGDGEVSSADALVGADGANGIFSRTVANGSIGRMTMFRTGGNTWSFSYL